MTEKTFKEKTREELLTVLPTEKCCVFAFLSAVSKVCGSIVRKDRRTNLCIHTEGYEESLRLVGILKSIYPSEFEIEVEHAKTGVKSAKPLYKVTIPIGFTKQALSDFGLMDVTEEGYTRFKNSIPHAFTSKACCAKSYFKGLYLACGSCYVPSLTDEGKNGYHFELQFDDENFAADVLTLARSFGIDAKTSERGTHTLVYVKDKDEIVCILGILGLADSALTLQGIIDERETANSINRTTICEAANLDKMYAAASEQLVSIGIIEERLGLDSLSKELLDTANARMDNRQASMSELADILGVSKSCVNHRLRRLKEIADSADKEFEKENK